MYVKLKLKSRPSDLYKVLKCTVISDLYIELRTKVAEVAKFEIN